MPLRGSALRIVGLGSRSGRGWRLLRWGAGLVLLTAGFLIYLRSEDAEARIRSGRYVHTSRLGWINWGHATVAGPKALLLDIQQRSRDAAGRPFTITYSQRQGGRIAGFWLRSTKLRTYEVAGGLTPAELNRVAFGIYVEVSDAFEEMQGSFPSCLDGASRRSSFRAGDLTGNLIGFYCALHGCEPTELLPSLGESSVEKALHALRTAPHATQRSWDLPAAMNGSPLAELRHDAAWFSQRAHLLRDEEKLYRFSLK